MLLFSTILHLQKSFTKEAFLRLVIQWNKESTYPENIIEHLNFDGTFPARWGDEKLWLAAMEYRKENIAAVRFEKHKEDGSVWDTDYVMHFDKGEMCIRLERSYRDDAETMEERFSTPHFISLLEAKGYLSPDGDLPVSRAPVYVPSSDLSSLADVILGKSAYRLPVIYVSRRFDGTLPVDIDLLASRVKGAAHVLVLKTAEDAKTLRELTESRNEYNGSAGIYYPTEAMPHRRLFAKAKEGCDSRLLEALARAVIVFANARITEPLFTWQGVNNALLNERIAVHIRERQLADQARKNAEKEVQTLQDTLDSRQQEIRRKAAEEAEKEAEKILDGFDNELRYLQKQVEELTRANESLQIENQGLKARIDESSEVPLIYSGRETDLYPGEIRDLLLTVLSEIQTSLPEKTRRYDVVKDLLAENEWQRVSEANAEEIKKLLKTYAGMTSAVRQKLESLGFEITEDGKHCKLTYYGDDRYQIILSKTPSDYRTGKNSSQKIIKTVF